MEVPSLLVFKLKMGWWNWKHLQNQQKYKHAKLRKYLLSILTGLVSVNHTGNKHIMHIADMQWSHTDGTLISIIIIIN